MTINELLNDNSRTFPIIIEVVGRPMKRAWIGGQCSVTQLLRRLTTDAQEIARAIDARGGFIDDLNHADVFVGTHHVGLIDTTGAGSWDQVQAILFV